MVIRTAVAVGGLEHFSRGLGEITCTATPVRDAHGGIGGVLDASFCDDTRQHHTSALGRMAATRIENGVLMHQMLGQTALAVLTRTLLASVVTAGSVASQPADVVPHLPPTAPGRADRLRTGVARQSCLMATVFSAEKPYSASKPFSRPWPERFTPPKGSSIPPPAP